jgi:hypothetical protein
MSRPQAVLTNIVFARGYTLRLLDAVPAADWFRMPPGGVTHVGWQVGHLAFAQYMLILTRVRGPRPDDAELAPPSFLALFGRDSVADPDPSKYPPAGEIRAVFDRVHARVLTDLPAVPDADLDGPLLKPHMLCRTKLECLHWCSHHEAIHAGQIGLIRRLLGHRPLW